MTCVFLFGFLKWLSFVDEYHLAMLPRAPCKLAKAYGLCFINKRGTCSTQNIYCQSFVSRDEIYYRIL